MVLNFLKQYNCQLKFESLMRVRQFDWILLNPPNAQLEVDSTKIIKFYTDKYNSLN